MKIKQYRLALVFCTCVTVSACGDGSGSLPERLSCGTSGNPPSEFESGDLIFNMNDKEGNNVGTRNELYIGKWVINSPTKRTFNIRARMEKTGVVTGVTDILQITLKKFRNGIYDIELEYPEKGKSIQLSCISP